MSIVIPCGFDPDGLAVTLESLRNCARPAFAYEVVVANDGNDTNVSRVTAAYGAIEVVLPKNLGPAAARNRAIEATAGWLIATLDCDLRLCPEWLEEAWRAGESYEYAGGRATINREFVRGLGHQYDAISAFDLETNLSSGHWVESVNLIVRRSLLEQVGGFDERLRSSEDRELGDRVFRFGATQGFWPAANVEHPPRNLREQWSKLRRTMMGHTLASEIWPERFPELGPGFVRCIRLVLPPRSVGRRDCNLTEFGVLRVPLFFLISWASKLCMLYHLLAIRMGGARGRTWGDFEFNGTRPRHPD